MEHWVSDEGQKILIHKELFSRWDVAGEERWANGADAVIAAALVNYSKKHNAPIGMPLEISTHAPVLQAYAKERPEMFFASVFAKENFSNGEYNIKKREAELAEKGLKKYLSDLYVYIKE